MPEEAPVYTATIDISVPDNVEYFKGRPFFRVLVEVTGVTGFTDDKLFVHQRRVIDADNYRDEFIGTAGPVDLVDFTDTPNSKFYLRKNSVNMLLESYHHYDELVNSVTSGIKALIDGMDRLNRMSVITTIEIT
jgi:hypothetical protein